MDINRDYTAKFKGTGDRTVKGVVLHDTAGSGKINDVKYLANPGDGRQVSVDFCVTRDGVIYQLSPDLEKHWMFHAGRNTRFKGHVNGAVNKYTVGIEIVQKADLSLSPTYPEAQVKSVAELCAFLCKKFKLVKDDITTHAKIITDGSRSDPRRFPFDKFDDYFNEASNEQKTIKHKVVAGDTLYSLSKLYKTTVEEIKRLNGMNDASNVISIGTNLIVKI